MTLAAFPRDTRLLLEQKGLIAPTLQMILRRNLAGVDTPGDYMSATAHPSVFDGTALRTERMIVQATRLSPNDVPPLVQLSMVEEDFGPFAGLTGQDERLFTTPSAIARLWRGRQWSREFVVSAEGTVDPNGRELTFYWTVLRGNPQKVTIEPLDETGSRARVRLLWHDAYPAPPLIPGVERPRMTSRVDIAVFASNGVNLSAPGFISVNFPTHQLRRYGPGPDGTIRLVSTDYDAVTRQQSYDPTLYWSAPWTDTYRYDDSGHLVGWTRQTVDGELDFDADGHLSDGRTISYPPPERINKQWVLRFEIHEG